MVTATSLLTTKCQKTQEIDENINIERENLNIFWTAWGTLIKFSGKMWWLNIKSHKKNKASLSLQKNANSEKVTINTVKIWNKATLSEMSEFSILGIGQNQKLGNLGNFHFF